MAAYTARITRVVDHGQETRSLFLERPAGLRFLPGQFLSCQLPIDGARVTKPYTVASSPDVPGDLELLFNRVPGGAASHYLFERRDGDGLDFTGPWGTFTLEHALAAPTIFIAEGTGIAAIRPMVHRAAHTATHPLHLLYATRQPLYESEFARLPGVTIDVIAPSTLPDVVAARWVTADDDRSRHFFVCGIGAIVHQLRDLLRGAGYARRAVHYEKW